MTHAYDDILHLPHPTSPKHPRMPVKDRAAIFSPFAALTGHGAAIEEATRLTEQRIELEEDAKEKLDRKQQFLENIAAEHPEITVTWFLPDEKKDGGSYVTHSGKLKKTDNMNRVIVMMDGTKIPLDDIIEIESIQFHGMFQDNL